MKKTLLLCGLALLAMAGSTYGQGTVLFINDANSVIKFAPGVNGGTNIGGAYTVGLYGGTFGTPEAALTLAGTTTIIGAAPGRFSGGTVNVPGVAGGGQATLQVRAWLGATYAAATSKGQSALWGQATGNLNPTDPARAITVAGGGGFTGFANVTSGAPPVPEPSTIAFGLLGLGAIALFRRRK